MAPPSAGAQAPTPVGGEFQINTYTTNNQGIPSVASASNGDFVVVWVSPGSSGTDTSYSSIQGQRYASDGSTQGAQFQINTYTTSFQGRPSVAADGNGDFVVVWDSNGSFGTDPSYSVQGQLYASNGSAQGAQFQVNTYTTSVQTRPSVTADADGDFVVVWQSNGALGDTSFYSIHGQRYASNGSTQGQQFQINTYTTGMQNLASVAADADGDFVVVWTSPGSFGTDTAAASVQGQRYASNGSAQGAEFQVNTYTTNNQVTGLARSVTADADGDFVVVWQSTGSFGTDTTGLSVQGRRYASNGSAQGAEFQVNSTTSATQWLASVAADGDGDFVVVWSTNGGFAPDGAGVFGQHYASNGSAQGAEFLVNTYTTNFQGNSSVAADADGDFVVVWESAGSFGTDTGTLSIQGQRYNVAAAPPLVPAMSSATRFAFSAALLLLGATYAIRRRGIERSSRV